MRTILDAGFVFWGLFLAFGAIVVGYVAWMVWTERRESREGPELREDRGPREGEP